MEKQRVSFNQHFWYFWLKGSVEADNSKITMEITNSFLEFIPTGKSFDTAATANVGSVSLSKVFWKNKIVVAIICAIFCKISKSVPFEIFWALSAIYMLCQGMSYVVTLNRAGSLIEIFIAPYHKSRAIAIRNLISYAIEMNDYSRNTQIHSKLNAESINKETAYTREAIVNAINNLKQ